MAAALTLAAVALSSPAHGQQADEGPTPTDSAPQRKAQKPETQSRPSVAPSSNDQTQDELGFMGRIEQQNGTLVLNDRVTKLTYLLNDQTRTRRFIGKHVKVKGKLELKSNTIEVSRIEALP